MLIYHLHSEYSSIPFIDSTTGYKGYIKKAKELGMKSICFTEHGNIYGWKKKKDFCESKDIGIKYIHGCEVYLTKTLDEKVQDNMHTILIAKNLEGFHELNSLVSISNDEDHFYYRPRISFDEFVNISPNIIATSACLAGPLNRLEEDDPWIERLINRYDFLEVQYHNIPDQLTYNDRLFRYAEKYNKRLIAGTDTHSLDTYEAECRYVLKKAKKSTYGDEDKFDLTFKNREQVKEMFKIQNSLSEEQIEEALDSTLIVDDMVEAYELDTSFKYPNDLYDDVHKEFKDRIERGFAEKLANGAIDRRFEAQYRERIEEEYRAYQKMGMEGFMSFMSELMTWCWDNNIPTGPARGSCAGSLIAYIINITDLDAIKWKTVFSRFVNEDRISLGDIDVDFDPEDKDRVYKYIIDRYGKGKTCYIATFPTIKELGAIQEICRGLDIPYGDVEAIKNMYKEDPEQAKATYPNVFYYFDGLVGTIISRGKHPAGMVGSPIDLHSSVGIQYIKDKDTGENCIVSQIDMKEIDSLNFVKYDILSLKNVGIIKETCELAGIPYPKSHTVDWEDKKVWKSLFDSPVGIFQFESKFGFESLKKFKAKSVEDMTLVTACIRPSGESYRDLVFDHQKNTENPTNAIDELLEDSLGYLVYQEQQIAFLQEMCGFTGGQADTIRRAIGKKDEKLLAQWVPEISKGYVATSNDPAEKAKKDIEAYVQIFVDSARYSFGYNHAVAYSMVGYLCAYLRYYYPVEFTTAFLRRSADESDVAKGTELAETLGIKTEPITFGHSDAYYTCKGKSIYKGMESVKFINAVIPSELNGLSDMECFTDLYTSIKDDTSVNSRQMTVLIKVDYFNKFGKQRKLLEYVDLYNLLFAKKSVKKDKLEKNGYGFLADLIAEYSKETATMYRFEDKPSLLKEIFKSIEDEDFDEYTKIKNEAELLGYVKTMPSKEGITVGKVVAKSYTKPWVLFKSFRNGKELWLRTRCKATQIPPRDSIVVIGNIEPKKSRKGTTYFVDIELVK